MNVTLKRVYEKPEVSDGKRVLVDRLWPRGLTKEKAKIGLWLKDIAPSTDLRQWFDHDLAKWPKFQKRYQDELDANYAVVAELRQLLKTEPTTIVYGAKDEQHNDAIVLKAYLEGRMV